MRYNITETDKLLLQQNQINYTYKLYVMDKNSNIVDELAGIKSIGSYNIDADSTIRRTTSFIMELEKSYHSSHIENKIETWIGYDFSLEIGIKNIRNDSYVWYKCGNYTITSTNTSYDKATNSISTELSDWFVKFDGTRNGQIGGAPTILIPNLDEDGNKVTIREAVVAILKDNGVSNYIVQDIGEYYGLDTVEGYAEYRITNPNWNQLPYDLEYSVGCTVEDILTEIRDLYPNAEMYWDLFGVFCYNMIPSCDNDPIICDDDFFQSIIIADNSEAVTYDIPSVKNVTEVFGHLYEIDRLCEECTVSSNVYVLNISDYGDEYNKGDIIAFTPPSDNVSSMRIQIGNLSSIPLYKEYTTEYVDAGTILKDGMSCIKISRSTDGSYMAYYLGKYQPHALCVLTNDENDTYYTKKYFSEKYNCEEKNITFRVEADNPLSIQCIGEVLDVKSGDEFDNIYSDSVALSNAVYYNQKSSTCNDIVTITTHMIPWLDVNIKVSYKKQQEDEAHEYIIKSISNDLDGLTSSIVMHRFYPLYFS